VETFDTLKINPEHVPAVLLPGHAPCTWGPDAPSAIQNAIALEESARMAFLMGAAQAARPELDSALVNKHFERKHGPRSYYGQATEKKGK
jgi:L-ribulose-5-phosphate 4-epimerase